MQSCFRTYSFCMSVTLPHSISSADLEKAQQSECLAVSIVCCFSHNSVQCWSVNVMNSMPQHWQWCYTKFPVGIMYFNRVQVANFTAWKESGHKRKDRDPAPQLMTYALMWSFSHTSHQHIFSPITTFLSSCEVSNLSSYMPACEHSQMLQ